MQKRVAHNAKARQSTAGSRKKRKRTTEHTEQPDSNASILEPKPTQQKEWERIEKRAQELKAESDAKWTAKKTHRLKNFVKKGLEKEERAELFKKLAKSQSEVSSLTLKSSSTLGTGAALTNLEKRDLDEDLEVRRAFDGTAGKRKRVKDNYAIMHVDESDEDEESDEELRATPDAHMEIGLTPDNPIDARLVDVEVVDSSTAPFVSAPPPPPAAVGSALKRNADGLVLAPRIKTKSKDKKNRFQSWKRQEKEAAKGAMQEHESDTSFDSSGSEDDSSVHDSSGSEDSSESDADASQDEEGESSDGMDVLAETPQPKKSLFKEWAKQQLSKAKGYYTAQEAEEASSILPATDSPPPTKKRRTDSAHPPEMRGPLGEDFKLPSTAFARHVNAPSHAPVKAVTVSRPPDVDDARLLLPIVTEEQPIMEAILLHPVVIICGETGSGKTTQVPQFLYEAGFGSPGSDNPGMIGITQPRRVAAMSMAARVAHELSLTSSRVSYQIRYDATVSPDTSIKFMTDGVLLRELASDFLLNKYSVIIIDEAHERSMNTDILIGVLSRVLKLREQMWQEGKEGVKPLRLIIMSATLRVSDFAENKTLFTTPPPIINVSARQHPVTVHFNRRTHSDYVGEAVRKAIKIHARLPPGGILIFLTGQNEISGVCRKLASRFGPKALEEKKRRRSALAQKNWGSLDRWVEDEKPDKPVAATQASIEAEDVELGGNNEDLALDVDDAVVDEDPEALDTDDEESKENEELGIDTEESDEPMHIVSLYSLLPSEKQMLVFKPPPSGSRLVVVATNVAETSLTIPGIRYVIDCGRAKERRYDLTNGVQAFKVSWISKASAAQRAGRAGRTGPGHCYRLYSSAVFENYFDEFSKPEILRMPIEGVVLQMKSMHVDSVVNFPFPTPPDRFTLKKSETLLANLGALTPSSAISQGGQITELGKSMSLFPLSPRFSRMLVSGQQHGCLPYVIAMVATLSVGDPFLREEALGNQEEQEDSEDSDSDVQSSAVKAKKKRSELRKAFYQSLQNHSALGNYSSDVFQLLSVVGAYEYAGGGRQFCEDHFVRPKAMEEIHKLRAQLTNIVMANFMTTGLDARLQPPSDLQLKVLKQLLTAAFIDQVAIRKDLAKGSATGQQFSTCKGVPYRAINIDEDVFIHPSSVVFNNNPPEYVVFNEVFRSSRVWLKGITIINPIWLASLGKHLCTYSKPTPNNKNVMMLKPKFGPEGWELPPIKAE